MTSLNGGRSGSIVADAARFAEERALMVAQQLLARGISDTRLLAAMLEIPRHLFVPAAHAAQAYSDQPLPIGMDQTISQPYMVAVMTASLALTGTERVLEIGTGSGYQAAILARLAREVFSVEVHASLAEAARKRFSELGITNAQVVTGDGSSGLAEHAPFDGILVTAAAPAAPQPLLEQLAEGGRLVIPIGPVGGAEIQELVRLSKRAGKTTQETTHHCRFVPLVGRYGWREGPA